MRKLTLSMALTLFASVAQSAGIVDARVEGNRLTAGIDLAGALDADLAVSFEQAIGLGVATLGLSVEVVSPLNIGLLGRLPAGATLPSAFPVLLRIEPPAGGGLSFSGVVTVELHTHALQYAPGGPLRLFAASDGGAFKDITEQTDSGSYRVRGSKGSFSEFMIVADLRTAGASIAEKFARLDGTLAAHAAGMDLALYSSLAQRLQAARVAYDSGDHATAIGHTDAFAAEARGASGVRLPDVWRSARDVVNVAGELRAAAATLRYSLTLAANGY
jgi:hypothetical protein